MDFVDFFRSTAPYIHAHRNKTLVALIPGEALDHEHAARLIPDLALLVSLGMRVVVVFGSRPQINQQLKAKGLECKFHHDRRITDRQVLDSVLEVQGQLRAQIEAQLSMGLINSPMHNAEVRCVSGNFVAGKPCGVLDGVDLQYTGLVRKVDTASIKAMLDQRYLVLMSHLGYSPSGEIFNLSVHDVAVQTAVSLKADKLVIIGDDQLVRSTEQELTELVPSQCLDLLGQHKPSEAGYADLEAAMKACRDGVSRCHLLPYQHDGVLLNELYTRDGVGVLVTQEAYDSIRPAKLDDIAGIVELLKPQEEEGILVRRSREILESEIDHFWVNERDGMVIGCAALYPFEQQAAELACVAVHPDYRHNQRGDRLLKTIEKQARLLGIERLFVLTTHTAHWFVERGFQSAGVSDLPEKRQSMYNYQRNSKVFIKNIGAH